jgi:DNA helicase-2/ATP-dependent DNA helicase PcrA
MRNDLSPKQEIAYRDFERILERIRQATETKPISEVVRTIVQASGFFDTLRQGSEEDRERLLNLEELVTFATSYDAVEGGLEKFLDDVALQSDQDELDKEDRKDAVRLMTIHAAKGLEFNTVFISGLEQGLFPSTRSQDKKSVEDREEERRLFYVAITRAKEKLYLSYAHIRTMYGQDTFNTPSEFLADIPVELIDHENAGSSQGEEGIRTHYLDF